MIRGIADKHIVELLPSEHVSPGGIIVDPDAVMVGTVPVQRGRVVAVGPGESTKKGKLVPSELRVGDVVHFKRSSGWEVPTTPGDSRKLIGLRESMVLFVEETEE